MSTILNIVPVTVNGNDRQSKMRRLGNPLISCKHSVVVTARHTYLPYKLATTKDD